MSAETLRKAAQILRERGWTQGRYEDDDGRCCAVGAIMTAASGSNDAYKSHVVMVQNVGAPLTTWNDAPGRTAEEVIAALEAAAARLDAS